VKILLKTISLPIQLATALIVIAPLWTASADIKPYQASDASVTLKEIIPQPDASRNRGEFYNEQYSISTKMKDGASSYLQLVISNLGAGDGKLGIVWELGLNDGTKVETRIKGDRSDWTTSKSTFDVRMGKNRWSGKPGKITIEIHHEGYEVTYELRNLVKPWKPGTGRLSIGSKGYYEFQLLSPMAVISMTGKKPDGTEFSAKGRAYMDHSRTNVASHELAKRWTRFRSFTGKQALHYVEFVPPSHVGSRPVGFAYVVSKKGVLFESLNAHGSFSDYWTDNAHKNRYRVPKKLKIEAQDGEKLLLLIVEGKRMAWRSDYLDSIGKMARMVVEKFAQPAGYGFDAKSKGIVRATKEKIIPLKGKGRYIVTHVTK